MHAALFKCGGALGLGNAVVKVQAMRFLRIFWLLPSKQFMTCFGRLRLCNMIHSKQQHGARSVLAARRLLAGDFFSKTETLWGGKHGSQQQAHY